MSRSRCSDDLTAGFDMKTRLIQDTRVKSIPSQTESSRVLRNSRIKRLIAFLVLEWLWLGFVLLLRFKIRPGVTIASPRDVESMATTAWNDYGLSSVGVLWQIISAVPILSFIREVYSGEWLFIKKKTDRDIDRVSTLTSGYWDQLKHTLAGDATRNFRIAFIIALLLVPLHSIAPSAVSTGPYDFWHRENITIGALRPNLTQATDTQANPFGNQTLGQAQTAKSKTNELAQKVVRFEYVTMVEQSVSDFVICDPPDPSNPSNDSCTRGHILFGMPGRHIYMDFYNNEALYSIKYGSDAVMFDFECQWLAPQLLGGSGDGTTWSFGDMMGIVDYQAVIFELNSPLWSGIYPLQINDGEGSKNGSFAWFIFGIDQSDQFAMKWNTDDDSGILVNLAEVPVDKKTSEAVDWSGIVSNKTLYNISTTASVLYCDPHAKFGFATIDVLDSGSTLWALKFEEGVSPVGNLDQEETSYMLGRSLNGIPWDTAVVTAANESSKLSRLAAEFLFRRPTEDVETSPTSIWVPQDLKDISNSLNLYTQIAGMSAYLDRSEGWKNASAVFTHSVDILQISWPKWDTSVALVCLVTVLVLVLTVQDFIKKQELVPFTLDGIQKYYVPINQKLDEA
ncbi:hypothetical protein ACEPAF_6852 [Sanghuangporus sanghuang]